MKALRWQDIELANRLLHVRRSKTPAGWRSPTLNAKQLDPTKGMTSWPQCVALAAQGSRQVLNQAADALEPSSAPTPASLRRR